jgi:hypothetical protein
VSYCEVIGFKNGVPGESKEFRNAWGGAAYIWDALYEKYLKDPSKPYDSWLGSTGRDDRRLWDLARREDIPEFMRAVHVSTFDHAIVRAENLPKFCGHLREFAQHFGKERGHGAVVCHLPGWADYIETLADVEAVGFYGTSCGENLWRGWDGEKDEPVPYDLGKRTDHYDVYDFLTTIREERSVPE